MLSHDASQTHEYDRVLPQSGADRARAYGASREHGSARRSSFRPSPLLRQLHAMPVGRHSAPTRWLGHYSAPPVAALSRASPCFTRSFRQRAPHPWDGEMTYTVAPTRWGWFLFLGHDPTEVSHLLRANPRDTSCPAALGYLMSSTSRTRTGRVTPAGSIHT